MLHAPVNDKKAKPETSRSEVDHEPQRLKSFSGWGNQAALRMMNGGVLQRKCACGNTAGSSGTCAECQSKRGGMLQTKLKISEPGDKYEQEADRIADQVMRMPEPTKEKTVQRKAIANSITPLQRRSSGQDQPSEVPPIVDEVLRAEGQPLDSAARVSMESRFGQDFSQVRVHTDSKAASAARSVWARAFTVGRNIVFGNSEFAPGTTEGMRIIAHELTHVIQQWSASTGMLPEGNPVQEEMRSDPISFHELGHTMQQGGEPMNLQRACVASPCPLAPVPIDALFPRYEAAEKCIQELYADSHPASKRGISLSFNADWVHLTGGTVNEKLALGCVRGEETPGAGPNFTAKSGMFAAAPDIWDFRNTTMYEITTLSGAAFRVGKLGAEITLANRICGTAKCGGLQFDRGTWSPPIGCFALGNDLYFSATNNQGVIIYNIVKDSTKELAMAALLALMAAALKKLPPKTGEAVIGKAVGKAIPAYAIAGLVVVAVLLASGKAEAKPGPGEDPLAALYKALKQKGTTVPPEIQKMLDENQDLKDKLNKAMDEGGDPTKAQEEISKQILDTIAANKDKFTVEDLELLLAITGVAGKALPKADMTVEELKKLAAAAKNGTETGGTTGNGSVPIGEATSPNKDDGAGMGKTSDTPVDKGQATGSKDGEANKDRIGQLSQETRDKLTKAPAPVRDLYNTLLGSSENAKKLKDGDVDRFLNLVPSNLTADQLAKLQTQIKEINTENVDQILNSLKVALAKLDKLSGDASASTKPPDTATLTIEPTEGISSPNRDKLIQELAEKAKKTSFADLIANQYEVNWVPPGKGKLTVGSRLSGNLRGKLSDGKTTYFGRIEAEVKAVDGKNLKIKFITATPMVGIDGTVIFPATHFVGREDNVTLLDPPKKKK